VSLKFSSRLYRQVAHSVFRALMYRLRLHIQCSVFVDSYYGTEYLISVRYHIWSRDSVINIATRYGLEGPGIESRWAETFRTYPDRLRDPPTLLYKGYRVFPGGKAGRGVKLTTHSSSAEVKKELSYNSTQPMGPPGSVTEFPFPLPLPLRYHVYLHTNNYTPFQ
jgi:hypothetical protein